MYIAYYSDPGSNGTIQPTDLFLETVYAYDKNGNQTSVTDALAHRTDYVYDEMNRQTYVWFPAAGTNASTTCRVSRYDALGRRTKEIDEAGIVTAFAYDFRGLLKQVILDSANTNVVPPNTTAYTYDEAGNLICQTDANSHTTQFQYDELDRRTKRILPAGQAETFGYDLAGNLQYRTNFNGVVITNQYDVADRLTNRASVAGYRVMAGVRP